MLQETIYFVLGTFTVGTVGFVLSAPLFALFYFVVYVVIAPVLRLLGMKDDDDVHTVAAMICAGLCAVLYISWFVWWFWACFFGDGVQMAQDLLFS